MRTPVARSVGAAAIALVLTVARYLPSEATIGAQAAGELTFTATSANVSEPGSAVSIRIFRWSTAEERGPLVAALKPSAPGVTPAAPVADPSAGRGVTGRGGRGRGARGRGDAAAPLTPIAALTAAIGRAPTVGYIWTNGVTGYSIKFAYRVPLPDGGDRIILATDRRLGAYSTGWRPATPAPVTDYEFTLLEMRLNGRGTGEGKSSLTTKVMLDSEAGTVALDDYAATLPILQNVKR